MTTFIYDQAAADLFRGDIDFETDVFKVILVDTATTIDTERDVFTLDDFVNLAEADGASYARQTLANVVLTVDTAAHRIKLTVDPSSFPILGANTSTLDNQAALVYVVRGGDLDTANLPLAYYADGGFPFTPSGATINITYDQSGFVRGDVV